MLAKALASLFLLAGLAQAIEPLRIHLLSGSDEYKSESSLKAFQAMLEKNYQVSVTATWTTDKARSVDNLKPVPEADLLMVFARRLNLPEDQVAVFRAHWEAGKPVMGIRTASHAFSAEVNEVFDRKVLGNHYDGHYGDEPVKVKPAEGAADHPVLKEVGEITSTKLYKEKELPETTKVLQIGDIGKDQHPVTLVNTHQGGRMFYTSLGVPSDFEDEDFLRLLLNAIFWTTKSDEIAYRK